ncbi:MAG: type II toxin-antitoxin system VapC family toxin [Methanophagales archaeon ANME-1-THS]|nr:MAG: type II toxin-antitoxin system VapC family toxin [Methanophagales archaeon ANME-1-THS]
MILDTSFLIDLMRTDSGAVRKLIELEKNEIAQEITAPTLYELYVGITLCDKPEKEKRKVLDTLTSTNILNLDAKSAEKAGEVQGRSIKEGMMIAPEDAMTAGIALLNEEIILTRNVEHFSHIKDLKIETY